MSEKHRKIDSELLEAQTTYTVPTDEDGLVRFEDLSDTDLINIHASEDTDSEAFEKLVAFTNKVADNFGQSTLEYDVSNECAFYGHSDDMSVTNHVLHTQSKCLKAYHIKPGNLYRHNNKNYTVLVITDSEVRKETGFGLYEAIRNDLSKSYTDHFYDHSKFLHHFWNECDEYDDPYSFTHLDTMKYSQVASSTGTAMYSRLKMKIMKSQRKTKI